MNQSSLPESNPSIYLIRPLKITLLVLTLTLGACDDHVNAPAQHTDGTLQSLNTDYGILHTTLAHYQLTVVH